MQERQRSWSAVPPAEFRRVSMRRLSHWSWQQQHLLQWVQALGAQEMQWAQALDKIPWLQMYTVPGNCMPIGLQTTEGSPSRTWQAGGGSFLLLPKRHALSRRWLWSFNHNTCENRHEEFQGAATSSLFMPPLYQDTWLCVQLLCVECNAPCQWDLAIDKTKPPMSAAVWQGNDQTALQCQAVRRCHHQAQWTTWAAWHWGFRPHSEGEKALLVWTCERSNGAVKTAFHIQAEGKRGPGRPKMIWKQLTERDCSESAMSGGKTLSSPGQMNYLRGLALRIWTSFWRREGSPGMDMWMLQWCSQDSLSHTGWGKEWAWEAQDDMEAADRERLQWVEALSYQPSW